MNTKPILAVALFGAILLAAQTTPAQVAGSTTQATVNVTEVAAGWSIKKKFLGKTVYNEDKKKVGKIEDVIIAPDGRASYVIIGAGGFVGVGRHDVAIPAGDLTEQDDKLVLPGATKEAIKAMPKFAYAKK
jgi:sporulation protein YlmC with PRC-barrel domain